MGIPFARLPILVYVFDTPDNVTYLTTREHWYVFNQQSVWGSMQVFVSAYNLRTGNLQKPVASEPELSRECTTLFNRSFAETKKFSSYLYSGLFKELRSIGFDEHVRILIRHQDNVHTLFQLGESGVCILAESTP